MLEQHLVPLRGGYIGGENHDRWMCSFRSLGQKCINIMVHSMSIKTIAI